MRWEGDWKEDEELENENDENVDAKKTGRVQWWWITAQMQKFEEEV